MTDNNQLTLSFSYVVGESLVLLRFKLRRLDMITKDDSPSSVTGVSHKFKDSKLWSCSATMWRPLSPNWKKRKSVPLRELILRMETVQSEWNFRLGVIFIHVCHEGEACSSSHSISNSISYSASSNNCLLSRDFWFEWNVLNTSVPFVTGYNWKWTSQLK